MDSAGSDSAYPTLLSNVPEESSFCNGMIRHEPEETCDGSSGSQSLSADHCILKGATTLEVFA